MLYPRITKLNGKEVLVNDNACIGYKEHLADKYTILFLSGVLSGDQEVHNLLMSLDTIPPYKPIKIVITFPGGDLDYTFLLYDTIKLMKSPIITIGKYCASAAAILLASGSQRYLFPHAKVLLHLATGQMGGDIKDFEIQHRQMKQYQEKAIDILCECGAKKSRAEILVNIDRDFWLEPKEAIKYGLADEIMTTKVWEGICQ